MQNYFDNLHAAKIYADKINSLEDRKRKAQIEQGKSGETFFSVYDPLKTSCIYSNKPSFKVSLDFEHSEFIKKIEKVFREITDS